MSLLDILDRPIAFHACLARLTGSVSAGLMLSQALYWQKRCPAGRNGWWYKSAEEWECETCLSYEAQRSARKVLRRFKWWQERRAGVPARLWFRIDVHALEMDLRNQKQDSGNPGNKTQGIPRSSSGESPELDLGSHQNKSQGIPGTNSEITTEITTEITAEKTNNTAASGGVPRARARGVSGSSKSDLVTSIFEHWQKVMDRPNAKLDSRRRDAIEDALNLGFSVDELKRAIDGCRLSSWHMGENETGRTFNDIDLILRDAKHIEEFQEVAEAGGFRPLSRAKLQQTAAQHEFGNWVQNRLSRGGQQ